MRIITQTPRLTIRTFVPEDEVPYMAMMTDPVVNEHLPVRTDDELRQRFHESMASDNTFNRWAMVGPDGNFAGMCLLWWQPESGHADTVELGYSFPQIYWNQGLATEMCLALIDYAATHPQITSITAVTTLGNISSQRVLQKAGFAALGGKERDGEMLAYFELKIKP